MKGMAKPKPVNEQEIIDVNTSPKEKIEALHDFLKGKIMSSQEWIKRETGVDILDTSDGGVINKDSIPF